MFDELTKYENNNHFFFTGKEKLENVCKYSKEQSTQAKPLLSIVE